MKKTEKGENKNKDNPFDGEIVESPATIKLMEFSDGTVWLTNDLRKYVSLMQKTEDERRAIMSRHINNDDRQAVEAILRKLDQTIDSPEVISIWNARRSF
ncbi:MAG: hypothetical protein E7310_06160 [Clostridiales bacterium]|nr:hypothetical protein [Clostridiales bacterium]